MADINFTSPAVGTYNDLLERIASAIDTIRAVEQGTIRQIDEKTLLRYVCQDLKRTGELLELQLFEDELVPDSQLEGTFIELDDARADRRALEHGSAS